MNNHWLNRSGYPFASKYFAVNSHQLHYIDEGKGETILFVHGTPSWSFDYRHIIKTLKINFRCIAIDHLGFRTNPNIMITPHKTTAIHLHNLCMKSSWMKLHWLFMILAE